MATADKPSILQRWLSLLAILTVTALLVAAASWVSPRLPGAAGAVYRHNVEQDIEATALLYSEACDIREYLDREQGRYGLDLSESDKAGR